MCLNHISREQQSRNWLQHTSNDPNRRIVIEGLKNPKLNTYKTQGYQSNSLRFVIPAQKELRFVLVFVQNQNPRNRVSSNHLKSKRGDVLVCVFRCDVRFRPILAVDCDVGEFEGNEISLLQPKTYSLIEFWL